MKIENITCLSDNRVALNDTIYDKLCFKAYLTRIILWRAPVKSWENYFHKTFIGYYLVTIIIIADQLIHQ